MWIEAILYAGVMYVLLELLAKPRMKSAAAAVAFCAVAACSWYTMGKVAAVAWAIGGILFAATRTLRVRPV
jgi:hypothetical protein